MAYVAIAGGEQAISGAADAVEYLRTRHAKQGGLPIDLETIAAQCMHCNPGCCLRAGFIIQNLPISRLNRRLAIPLRRLLLRAWRSTRARLHTTDPHSSNDLRLIRRISAAFKDIPGGQRLGPTRDYTRRLFRSDLIDESPEAFQEASQRMWDRLKCSPISPTTTFPRVVEQLRNEGLLPPIDHTDDPDPFDITREPLVFPVPRSAALSTLARGESGGILALGYSVMRSYGDIHPTVAELRVGYLPAMTPHPVTGEPQGLVRS